MTIVTTFYCPHYGSVMYPEPFTNRYICPYPNCVSNKRICPYCGQEINTGCPIYIIPQTTDGAINYTGFGGDDEGSTAVRPKR